MVAWSLVCHLSDRVHFPRERCLLAACHYLTAGASDRQQRPPWPSETFPLWLSPKRPNGHCEKDTLSYSPESLSACETCSCLGLCPMSLTTPAGVQIVCTLSTKGSSRFTSKAQSAHLPRPAIPDLCRWFPANGLDTRKKKPRLSGAFLLSSLADARTKLDDVNAIGTLR